MDVVLSAEGDVEMENDTQCQELLLCTINYHNVNNTSGYGYTPVTPSEINLSEQDRKSVTMNELRTQLEAFHGTAAGANGPWE